MLQDTTRAATRASKQAEKGKAVAAAPGASPKGKAAAKRAAEPVSQAEKSPKKVAKRSSDEPATPAKAPPAPAGSLKQPTSDQRPGTEQNLSNVAYVALCLPTWHDHVAVHIHLVARTWSLVQQIALSFHFGLT